MKNTVKREETDVVILCGGKGKRLQSLINDRPKALADINGHPFLDILINYVARFRFKRFILCTGYMGNLIKQYYHKRNDHLTFILSEEKNPLGTAGAIYNAEAVIKSNPFLVMNSDSFCQLDFNKFIDFHISKKALNSIVLVKAKESKSYGMVRLGNAQQVIAFDEKPKSPHHEFINAGIYLLSKNILSLIPPNKKFSLEYDILPKIINKSFFGYTTNRRFIDIGTPEKYKEAKLILKGFYNRKKSSAF